MTKFCPAGKRRVQEAWRLVVYDPPPIGTDVDLSRDGKTRLDTILWTRYISEMANKVGLWWRLKE